MSAKLLPGIQVVAIKIQEAMMQSDIRARLSDAINDAHRQNGQYGYYIDHTGDDSGDVVYSCNGDVRMCGYSIEDVGGKAAVNLDMEDATDVVPVTTYQAEVEDSDHYTSMEESLVKAKLYTELPLYERFISKDERKSASDDDFAGKGRSFPILKPEDVSAAVHAMGRAGSDNVGTGTLKNRIIAIAKRKGWTQYLPKAWRGDDSTAKESGKFSRVTKQTMELRESFDWKEDALRLIESTANPMRMKIKLIAPGKGSSAFYPAEVLKRDGPNVFTKGTHIYINHATSAEESSRPEGDWHKLAGALDGNAYWDESAKTGPGLYGDALFTSDYAPLIKEKASFTGMSIRAAGVAESGKKKDGLPILKELTHAESVDVVTRAGAGGMILTESARGATNQGEVNMTDAEKIEMKEAIKVAVAEAVTAVAKPVSLLEARALRGDAVVLANRQMATMNLHESFKAEVVTNVLRDLPLKDGAIDEPKFAELITAESKRLATIQAQLTGAANIVGMGPSGPAETDPVKIAEARKRQREEDAAYDLEEARVFSSLTGIRLIEKEEAA